MGEWVESKSTKIVERRNPANTDDVVARIPLSTREEMKRAIAAAKAAFPAWRDTPAPQRGKILFKAARLWSRRKKIWPGCSPRRRKDAEGRARRSTARHQHRGIHGRRSAAYKRRNPCPANCLKIFPTRFASRSAWSAPSHRGISRSRFLCGKLLRRSSAATRLSLSPQRSRRCAP